MTVKERAAFYFSEERRHCSETMFLAADDVYGLGATEQEGAALRAFGGGMHSGSTCGALVGSMMALGRLYNGRPDFPDICAKFVSDFRERMGCGSLDCAVLNPRLKDETGHCLPTVEIAADLLQETIEALGGPAGQAEG